MKPKRLLSLGVLLLGVTAVGSLSEAQKPGPPQPTEQQELRELKERLDALESRLRVDEETAKRADSEKELQGKGFWNAMLGAKGQAGATWIYTLTTAALLYYVIRQVGHAQSQIQQVEGQLFEMRASRDLGSFETFIRLWDDSEVRTARRHVYGMFGPALRKKDPLERRAELEKVIGGIAGLQRDHIDIVINKSNLVGLLWSEGLLSSSMRRTVLPYIYKTVIQTWVCLEPYVRYVRAAREEVSPGTIHYAAPFESLWKEAEALRVSRKEEMPAPPAAL